MSYTRAPIDLAIVAIIPARFGSTRLPGKPLSQINGKPMVQHVWERARIAQAVDRVLVATDDERIAQAAALLRDAGAAEVRNVQEQRP